MIDYHCHILPEIDDGAKNADMSCEMQKILNQQGVKTIVATPHYYMFDESVNDFLIRREKSYQKFIKKNTFSKNDVVLGTEVYLQKNITKTENFKKLCIGSSNFILIEMPYEPIKEWMKSEIDDIIYNTSLTPVFAHIDRYHKIYSTNDLHCLFEYNDAIFQYNTSSLKCHKVKKEINMLYKLGFHIIFGSDSHNITTRSPSFNLLSSDFANKAFQLPLTIK